MDTNQYIVTVELWCDGKAASWDQFSLGVWKDAMGKEILEKIRLIALDGRDKEIYAVKVINIMKL